jgi:hypothetical protein
VRGDAGENCCLWGSFVEDIGRILRSEPTKAVGSPLRMTNYPWQDC